ncbi:MAG: hypothetical protein JWO38_2364 [Gemmataceae bacterium]|nr:hypothetical protein [Gemmataceae bacterium]
MLPTAVLALALAPCPAGVAFDRPLLPVTVPAEAPHGYTYAPARDLDMVVRLPARRYDPQPGDVILMSDTNAVWTTLYAIAFTGPPGHMGIVVRLPDGRLGMHEAGFNGSLWTRASPLDYRINQYPGKVWVRRVRTPLSPEQDARLTEFAQHTDNARYDIHTAMLQLTPFRRRGPLRTAFLARPNGPHQRLICSEAVLEGLVYAGVIDGRTARPGATFPRDLFFDRSPNPYINRHPPLAAGWDEPALWTPVVGLASKGKERPPIEGVVIPPPEVPSQGRCFCR